MELVLGGSGSGKSAYAEGLFCNYPGNKYYIATMQIYGEEGKKRVLKHRKMREGKGFFTVEAPTNFRQSVSFVDGEKEGILLECMSNLVANEMFDVNGQKTKEEVCDKILQDVEFVSKRVDKFVIVSNNIFEEGASCEGSVKEYLDALAKINIELTKLATEVTEVVVGIPVKIKK